MAIETKKVDFRNVYGVSDMERAFDRLFDENNRMVPTGAGKAQAEKARLERMEAEVEAELAAADKGKSR